MHSYERGLLTKFIVCLCLSTLTKFHSCFILF